MGSLVVYFSHEGQNSVGFDVREVKKGHTRIVAEKIAELTGSDILRIEPVQPYPADYDECCKRAKEEADGSFRPEIKIPIQSLDSYDEIYIGFPIWYRSYPRVIATFIGHFDFTGKKVWPFCTNEEGAFGMADMELEAAIRSRGGQTMRGLAVRGGNAETCDDQLKRWLGK